MKEISLHILDIVQNSIRAGADHIKIEVNEKIDRNILEIIVDDNGKGMSQELVSNLKNPFTTTRTTRKVGLGVPLLQEAAKRSNGHLDIVSKEGVGTKVQVSFEYNHIDRAPIGDIVNTITMLILSKPEIRYIFAYSINEKSFKMDTDEIKKVLDGVPINDLSIIKWLEEYLKENISAIKQ